MYQNLEDPVDVIAIFENQSLKPARFRWRGKVHKVTRVTGSWKSREGTFVIRHFSLLDTDANFFELTYNERLSQWTISKIWLE